MRVIITIDNNSKIMVLPYVTSDMVKINYGQSSAQNSDSVKYGQIKTLGPEPLAMVSITGIFPKGRLPFMERDAKTEPMDYVKFFRNNRRDRKPFRVIITRRDGREVFNRLMSCESFEISPAGRNGEIPYQLELEQYRMVR